MISRGATVRHELVKQKVDEDKFHVLAVWPFDQLNEVQLFSFSFLFFLKNDSKTSYNFTTAARPLKRMKRT